VTDTTDNDQPTADKPAPDMRKRMAWVVGVVVALLIVAAIIGTAVSRGAKVDPTDPASSSSSSGASQSGSPSASSTPPPATANASEQAPTPIGDPADTTIGVTVTIPTITAVDGEGRGAGEVSGPAVQFVVSIANTTAADVSLAGVVVNVYYGDDQSPAGELTGGASSPLPGTVGASATVTGTYVFSVPQDQRSNVRITVDYQAGTPVVVFQGAAPTK